ncbi:glycosyltransferase [Candidatus Omnitrophota bacterium]
MYKAKKILLLYISILSGHHRAAMAIERALKFLDPEVVVYSINSFNYTNPILSKVINQTYSGIIKTTPEVWEYIYDNPKIVKNSQRLKEIIHRYNSSKMKALIEEFNPDVVACTQAFPCGMVADYKNTYKSDIPLVGVLTDFYPHSYWLYETVNRYVVSSDEAKAKLCENGIPEDRIKIFGIPIDESFKDAIDKQLVLKSLGLSEGVKTVLVMGGSSGHGPIKRIVLALDRIQSEIQTIVVTGTNSKLNTYLRRRVSRFRKKVVVTGYAGNVNELMAVSDIIITKPGGLTVSEALSKSLAIIVVNPIPGQEAKNTEFLLGKKAALKAANEHELAILVDSLCRMPSKLEAMKHASRVLGKPDSAMNLAKMILEL